MAYSTKKRKKEKRKASPQGLSEGNSPSEAERKQQIPFKNCSSACRAATGRRKPGLSSSRGPDSTHPPLSGRLSIKNSRLTGGEREREEEQKKETREGKKSFFPSFVIPFFHLRPARFLGPARAANFLFFFRRYALKVVH